MSASAPLFDAASAFPPGTVILTEKPSVATDIALALAGVAPKKNGYIELPNGVILTWAIGHLIQQAKPHEYDPALKKWSFDTLPFIPTEWKHVVRDKGAEQLAVIGRVLKQARLLIIATDAGREGELIARELLQWFNYRGAVKRLWLQAMTKKDIMAGFAKLKDGRETEGLWAAAVARSEADFLYGINGTRSATLAINQYQQLYPIGRVQTPTLYLVVKRMLDIENFKPQDYYELAIDVTTANGHALTLTHAPKEDARITDIAVAERMLQQVSGASSPLSVTTSPDRERPPLPHNLASLQQEANRAFGLSAQETLDVAQALYEKKKALSYPRTGCPYLSSAQKEDVEPTLSWIAKLHPEGVSSLRAQGIELRDSVFDDSKLEDHHGLVPKDPSRLLEDSTLIERQVYALVAARYLRAIAPDVLFNKTVILMDANSIPFQATGKVVTRAGWRGIKINRPE